MCKGLSYISNELTVGDPEEFPEAAGAANDDFRPPKGSNINSELWQDNDCESWFSISVRDDSNAMACYSAVGGSMVGRCVEMTIPPPTTTVTTETSTTSEHPTTESSTTTATTTATTITFTTGTSSTTPHTTTGTTVTTATETTVSSGADATRST